MKRDLILNLLVRFGDYSHNQLLDEIYNGAPFESFCRAMEGNNYGGPETLDAWHWFLEGWKGHIKGPRS